MKEKRASFLRKLGKMLGFKKEKGILGKDLARSGHLGGKLIIMQATTSLL